MHALVVYESMYGNTKMVADAIADGIGSPAEVRVLQVSDARTEDVAACDLLVVGGPTHVHGISRISTRHLAVDTVTGPEGELVDERNVEGEGLREWLGSLPGTRLKAATFDTRIDAPALFTGRASKGIAKSLRNSGFEIVAEPESFLISKETHLLPGEEDRARKWGRMLRTAAQSPGSGRPE